MPVWLPVATGPGAACWLAPSGGLAPGRRVSVLQTAPVAVVRVEHLELALETALTRAIAITVADASA